MQSRQSATWAFVLCLLIPFWGLFYVGRLYWALAAIASQVFLFYLVGWFASPTALIAGLAITDTLNLVLACTAAWIAHRGRAGKQPSGKRLAAYAVAILIMLVGLLQVTGPLLGFQVGIIPSTSMRPALQVGDYIIGDCRADAPKVGDIVLYSEENGTTQFKRVAGVAGDTLEIVNGELIVNGSNLGLFHALPEMVRHPHSLTLAPVVVEPGHVFVLGDNRDNSNDSRFMGQILEANVTAKVTGIFASSDYTRIGTTFE
ncbi:signal peptidase I [Pseudomonas sp. MWU13-3659]|uniref:signal peptidase I n=1 Tax=Pseudomonas sp. MWU13-3659 TaxID=2986964 RepID=UPI002075F591|nr:signal peptidase I [Pseudomonas sp. MWU13-3659]